MALKLNYYGGDGFNGQPEIGKYEVMFGIEQSKIFNRLTKARGFYENLESERAIWDLKRGELIEAYVFCDDAGPIELPFPDIRKIKKNQNLKK